ncbi:FAD-dependent oxidoreductase, partial [Klebsiella pneumoniae]|uniref:FAD-dependent oxidoreductase n=1 Tax=Klebsiella pneumoniae TaxID=573 RepID=UPI0013D68011
TALFKKPFWNEHFQGSYIMSDAFGGCCIYDESARHPSKHGVLGWLITATEALALSNLDDETLIQRALDSLPTELLPLAK